MTFRWGIVLPVGFVDGQYFDRPGCTSLHAHARLVVSRTRRGSLLAIHTRGLCGPVMNNFACAGASDYSLGASCAGVVTGNCGMRRGYQDGAGAGGVTVCGVDGVRATGHQLVSVSPPAPSHQSGVLRFPEVSVSAAGRGIGTRHDSPDGEAQTHPCEIGQGRPTEGPVSVRLLPTGQSLDTFAFAQFLGGC